MIPVGAFEEAYALHYVAVARSLASFRFDAMTVEDIVHDAFLRLLRQPVMPNLPLAWLILVARRRALEWIRNGSKWIWADVLDAIEDGRLSTADILERDNFIQTALAPLKSLDREMLLRWSVAGPVVWGQPAFTHTELRRIERAKRRLRALVMPQT